MKIIVIALALALGAGCASAEQRISDKQGYRQSQVEAIKVQAEQRTARKSAEELSEAAMWQSLAAAVAANPDSASHFAIVMAVAAARGGDSDDASEPQMVTLKTEQSDAQAWAKILAAPVLSTITNVGIAAVNADLQKEISRNATKRDIVEAEQSGRIYDAIGTIAENRGTDGDTYNVSDNAVVNTGSQDNDNIVVGIDTEAADDAIDEVFSFGIDDPETPDDTGVDDPETPDDPDPEGEPEDEPEDEVDCSEPQFSPMPEECML